MLDSTAKFVWFPDSKCGFAIGKLVDIGQTTVSVQPIAWPSVSSVQYEQAAASSQESYQNNNNNNNSQQPLEFPYKSVYPCDHFESNQENYGNTSNKKRLGVKQQQLDVDDSCALIQLNEAALLENVRLRFHRDKIYTYVAHILIAVNPYFAIEGLHSEQAIASYQGKSLGTMPPHVYAIADKAYRDMKAFKRSQSIIISGESGAGNLICLRHLRALHMLEFICRATTEKTTQVGKTESQKYVLRYLCLSGSQSGRLEKLILDANPILEAFGNAKTIRNNNSSRFGKFIEVHYSHKFQVTGGLFLHYLLEKSRICTQSLGERNYHIFYQLCACLPTEQWNALELGAPDKFRYLKGGCTQYFSSNAGNDKSNSKILATERCSQAHKQLGPIQDQLIDDLKCYEQTDGALSNFGLNASEKLAIYSIVAAVLHLGNIEFCDDPDDNRGGCKLDSSCEQALQATGRLIGLEADLLRQALISRIMSTARGGHKGTVYMVQLSQQQAQAARDALAKAIYSKLFDYIVTKIVNKSIPDFERSSYYIGVLDVAGFEYFQHNSFEQFLINFCNEKLQQFFNERILKEEQNIYETEGLNLERVEFVDNQDCIQLFELRSKGIFDLLDEESRLPKPSAQHFTQSVHEQNRAHFRLALPRASKLKAHREIRDDEGFLVRHFAGAVCYETSSFIEKNNDALHASLKSLMAEADNRLVRELFDDSSQAVANATQQQTQFQISNSSNNSNKQNKLNFVSVGSTFRAQLNELMQKLQSTGSHFIRCMKPNSEMVAHKFEGGQILSQLHCSGMDSVLRLMQQGYPSRLSFQDLYQAYSTHLPPQLARLDAHLFCRALFKALGLSERDFRFGSSKVFFKPAKFAEFDQLIRTSDQKHVAALVARVSQWLVRARWRKGQYCALSVVKLRAKILFRREQILLLQRFWRAAIVRRKLHFRLVAIKAAKQIGFNLEEFEQIIGSQMKKSPERSNLEEESRLLREEITAFCGQLKQSIQSIISQQVNVSKVREMAPQAGKDTPTARQECEKQLELLRTKRDLLIRSIRDKIARQQRELAELERQMAEERELRETSERARLAEEQAKKQRQELELRRQAEALKLNDNVPQQPPPKQLVDSATDPISLDYLKLKQQQQAEHEQEQRDYELALRLAQERGSDSSSSGAGQQHVSPVAAAATLLAPSENLAHAQHLKTNLNLTKWKYSDLRDTINTSCDLELLEACKREFHRRLKVYHAWRAMNNQQRNNNQQVSSNNSDLLRAPSCIMNQTANVCDELSMTIGSQSSTSANNAEQRYFRIPFLRPQTQAPPMTANQQRGWWFAHFDGQWIARQLELHPNREPILLVAGEHDIDMCELSLSETRLTSKRGAEILAQEFEAEWRRHGGQPYARQRNSAGNLVTQTGGNTNLSPRAAQNPLVL